MRAWVELESLLIQPRCTRRYQSEINVGDKTQALCCCEKFSFVQMYPRFHESSINRGNVD